MMSNNIVWREDIQQLSQSGGFGAELVRCSVRVRIYNPTPANQREPDDPIQHLAQL